MSKKSPVIRPIRWPSRREIGEQALLSKMAARAAQRIQIDGGVEVESQQAKIKIQIKSDTKRNCKRKIALLVKACDGFHGDVIKS